MINAAGILSLLDEDEYELKLHALKQLNTHVSNIWSEMASSILKIESLCDDDDFKDKQLAAIVASKVFYHLEELNEALKYALRAGDLFDLNDQSEYVQTLGKTLYFVMSIKSYMYFLHIFEMVYYISCNIYNK